MDVTLICNGYDLSPFLSSYSLTYETAYDKTVKALDGTEYSGNLTSRPIVTFSLRPMTDTLAQQCYNALTAASPASCVYTGDATYTAQWTPALQIYIQNDVLVASGSDASVSTDSFSLVSDDVSVSDNIFRYDGDRIT